MSLTIKQRNFNTTNNFFNNIFVIYYYNILTIHTIFSIFIIFTTNHINTVDNKSLEIGTKLSGISITTKNPDESNNIFKKILEITRCSDRPRDIKIEERGGFLVYYNLVTSLKTYHCHESITLTTQCDYTYLDNLVALVDRWRGPISLALYAPGEDFPSTMESIAYLRHCHTSLIRKYVTFHVFYDREHYPRSLKRGTHHFLQTYDKLVNCTKKNYVPPYLKIKHNQLYKTKKGLKYPINVARNIAREMAQTHYVFASDIELIPSTNIITRFLKMIVTNSRRKIKQGDRKVYALPVFEVPLATKIPSTKTELQRLYKSRKAFFFHEKLCLPCHGIPNRTHWIRKKAKHEIDVFTSVKRMGEFKRWEPFYIGTHVEPLFDERVTWEGASNKMIQDFTLCLLNYDILVLDNAFLVHKAGISNATSQLVKDKINMSNIIKMKIKPELEDIYGKRNGCVVGGQFN